MKKSKNVAVSQEVEIVPLSKPGGQLATYKSKVADYLRAGLEGADNTKRGYAADLRHYNEWCSGHQVESVPISPDALSSYLAYCADKDKWATIQRRLSAIRKLHKLKGVNCVDKDRQVSIVLEGIRRVIGVRQVQAPAFGLDEFKEIIRGLDPNNIQQLRDKVVLLLGFMGAFRRSELVSINIENIKLDQQEAIISLGKSKTNQYGDHEEKAIFCSPDQDLCPVHTLRLWLAHRPDSGPLLIRFRKGDQPGVLRFTEERLSVQSVANIVKHYLGEQYSAHSLRASFVTIAKLAGADDGEVMQQTKHKTTTMIQRYTRVNNVRQHNAGKKLGL